MYEVGKWIWEHRNEPLTWVTLISFLSLVIDKFGRKLITNQLKRLFHVKDKSEFAQYKANQLIIMDNQRLIMKHLGVPNWDVPYSNGKQSQSVRDGRKNSLLHRLTARFRALIIGAFTIMNKALYHSKIREGNTRMKNYLKKLGSRKFQAFLSVTIPNMIIMFGFILGDIDLEGQVNQWMPAINLIIQAITTATYQRAEGNYDVAKIKAEVNNDTYATREDSEGV